MLQKLEKEVKVALENNELDMYILIAFPKEEGKPVAMLADIDPVSAGCAMASWAIDNPECLGVLLHRIEELAREKSSAPATMEC